MPDQTSTIISKVWGMCGPLRDDGVSYGDYLEQLYLSDFPKNVRRVRKAALQPSDRHSGRLRLGGYERPQGCGAGREV